MYLKSASTIEMEAPVSEAPSHASSPVRKPCVVNLEFGGAPARGSRSGALQDWRGTDLNKVGQAVEKLSRHVNICRPKAVAC